MGNWLGGTHLGLTYGHVRRVSSDPSWPEAFQRLVVQLRAARPGGAGTAVEHVGSAAVSGLAAKPILDIAIGLAPASTDRGHHPPPAAGCPVPGGQRRRGAACCWCWRTDPPTGGGPAAGQPRRHPVAPHLALPDRLRADQAARSAYAQLKGRLAAQFSGDRCAYTAAETAFIQQLPSEDGRTATRTEQTVTRRGPF